MSLAQNSVQNIIKTKFLGDAHSNDGAKNIIKNTQEFAGEPDKGNNSIVVKESYTEDVPKRDFLYTPMPETQPFQEYIEQKFLTPIEYAYLSPYYRFLNKKEDDDTETNIENEDTDNIFPSILLKEETDIDVFQPFKIMIGMYRWNETLEEPFIEYLFTLQEPELYSFPFEVIKPGENVSSTVSTQPGIFENIRNSIISASSKTDSTTSEDKKKISGGENKNLIAKDTTGEQKDKEEAPEEGEAPEEEEEEEEEANEAEEEEEEAEEKVNEEEEEEEVNEEEEEEKVNEAEEEVNEEAPEAVKEEEAKETQTFFPSFLSSLFSKNKTSTFPTPSVQESAPFLLEEKCTNLLSKYYVLSHETKWDGFIKVDYDFMPHYIAFYNCTSLEEKTSDTERFPSNWAIIDEMVERKKILSFMIDTMIYRTFVENPALLYMKKRIHDKTTMVSLPRSLYLCQEDATKNLENVYYNDEHMSKQSISIFNPSIQHPLFGLTFLFTKDPLETENLENIKRFAVSVKDPVILLNQDKKLDDGFSYSNDNDTEIENDDDDDGDNGIVTEGRNILFYQNEIMYWSIPNEYAFIEIN